MNDKLPSFPSITELFQHGLVATASVVVGLLFIFMGAFGDVATSNKKLFLGACVLCFGIMWHFGGQIRGNVDYADSEGSYETNSYLNWNHIFTSFVFLLMSLLSGFVFVTGHFPWKK